MRPEPPRIPRASCATDGVLFDGFTERDVSVSDGSVHARIGGAGPPVLLLHGYPQTHAMWHLVAPGLTEAHTVVVADIRGYGRSTTTSQDFTFRATARDQVELMEALEFDRFHVVGHDRGARVAHRLVLDHPGRVSSLALLDINPTLDVWRLMDDWLAKRYWHWSFLAQGNGLPQRLIGGDPVFFLHRSLAALSGDLDDFDPRALADYESAARRPSVVDAWCQDYRCAAGVDLEHDRLDEDRTSDVPALVLWGSRGVVGAKEDPLEQWGRWFSHLRGHAVEAGHFLAEERPQDVLDAISTHLSNQPG